MDSRETFRRAKLSAIRRYAEQAERDIAAEQGRNKMANARKRLEWARRHEALFQDEQAFWGNCGMEFAYQIFIKCGCDVTDVSAV